MCSGSTLSLALFEDTKVLKYMSYGMFRLPLWSSVVGGNKVTAEDVKALAAPPRPAPVMESTTIRNLKRKRSDSGEFDKAISRDSGYGNMDTPNSHSQPLAGNTHVSVKAQDTAPLTASSSAASNTQAPSPEKSSNGLLSCSKDQDPLTPSNDHQQNNNNLQKELKSQSNIPCKMVDPNTLRETVEAQLSLEILLKHDELRLIDQEIAKCQVALEQLRRCHEIPYPVSNQTGPSLSVSSGTGFSIPPRGGSRAPSSPAPWGVSDGPYSRHYSTWLLPDARFDGGEPEVSLHPATGAAGNTVSEGRTTRASWNETGGSMSRSQRGSKGTKLQALSNGYPTPKEKAGPMIIKRKSDGQYVKLVCIDCRRDNFSSTQGFINHCRIAHNRSFASHDAAAQASGEPVEVDESGAVLGNGNESSSSGPPGYVHPLIRAAHVVDSKPKKSTLRKKSGSSLSPAPNPKPDTTDKLAKKQPPTPNDFPLTRQDVPESNTSFKASPQTPHLSALMQRRGLGLDLLNIVDDALSKTDMDIYSSGEESGDEADPGAKNGKSPLDARGSRLPARTVASSSTQRPESRKGADKGGRKPRASASSKPPTTPGTYIISLPLPQASPDSAQPPRARDRDADTNLSPHTVESNQAPSLVSDDGEGGARTSESPSPSASGLSESETMFDNIEVQDDGNESTGTGSAPDVAVNSTTGKHRPATMSRPASTSKVRKPKATARGGKAAGSSNSPGEATAAFPAVKKGGTKRQRRK